MVRLLRTLRRRALMSVPTDRQLDFYLECFAAGYQRGIADVAASLPEREWLPLISAISLQLADYRSVMEAGCWLAGVRLGRDDAVSGEHVIPERTGWLFCQAWEREFIGECALECDPPSIRLTTIIAGLCRRKPGPLSIRVLQRTLSN